MGPDRIAVIIEKGTKRAKDCVLMLASVILALMMLLTVLDVLRRYIFRSPIPGALETIEYMMAVLIPFALVVTAYDESHIGVDFIVEHLPSKLRTYLACVTNALLFALFSLIAWQSFLNAWEHYESGMTSAVLLIPHYPFAIPLAIAFLLSALITLGQFLRNLVEAAS